jgi:hypothetical protein
MNPNHKTSSTKSNQTPVEQLVFDPKKMTFNDFVANNAVLFIPEINTKMLTMGGLKLGLLPPLAQEFFIRWLFEVNRPRLIQGLPLLVTYGIIKQCPLWKVIPMPYRNIAMNKDTTAALGKMIPPEKRLKFVGIK